MAIFQKMAIFHENLNIFKITKITLFMETENHKS